MTDEERQNKIDELWSKITPHEGLTEAGGIAFTTLYSRTGAAYNVTARELTPAAALADLVHTVEWAYLALGMTTTKPEPPTAKPAAVPADQRIASEEGNKPLAAQLKADAEAIPNPPDGKTWQTFDARRVLVIPQPDNKTTIEFYGADRKFPDVKVNKWTVERAAALLKHVTAEPVDKPGDFTLPCRVYYTEGKQYTKTNGETGHYKDIGHVRPLA